MAFSSPSCYAKAWLVQLCQMPQSNSVKAVWRPCLKSAMLRGLAAGQKLSVVYIDSQG